jgi:DNA-directed RNA polymerase specialized sigma24 family protein
MRAVIAVRERRPAPALALDWTLAKPRPLSDGELELLWREKHAELERIVAWRLPGAPWHIVEEAVEQAFCALIGRRVHRPVGWLIVTGYFRALDLLRQAQRETCRDTIGAVSAGIWLQIEARELLRAIARLPRRDRELLGLRLAGVEPREIAAELGVCPHTVHSYVWQARRALRRLLEGGELLAQPTLLADSSRRAA